MKKMFVLIMMLLIAFTSVPAVFADEGAEENTEAVEVETEEEVKAMDNSNGRTMRLLQLEKSISRALIRGQVVVDEIFALEISTDDLQIILDTMEELKTEVMSVDINSEDAVREFVDLKKNARDLTKEFRTEVKTLVKEEDLENIRSNVKEVSEDALEELNDKIKEKRNHYNAEKLEKAFKKLGAEGKEELVAKIKEGNLVLKEARVELKERMKEMGPEERKKAFSELKKEVVKRNLEIKSELEEFKQGMKERRDVRKEQRGFKALKRAPKGSVGKAHRRDAMGGN